MINWISLSITWLEPNPPAPPLNQSPNISGGCPSFVLLVRLLLGPISWSICFSVIKWFWCKTVLNCKSFLVSRGWWSSPSKVGTGSLGMDLLLLDFLLQLGAWFYGSAIIHLSYFITLKTHKFLFFSFQVSTRSSSTQRRTSVIVLFQMNDWIINAGSSALIWYKSRKTRQENKLKQWYKLIWPSYWGFASGRQTNRDLVRAGPHKKMDYDWAQHTN